MDQLTERCPWCGSEISHAKFVQVQERIRAEEKRKAADAEAALRKKFEEKYLRDLQAGKSAAEKLARAEAAKEVTKATSERDLALQKLKQAEVRESALRKQAQEEAERKAKAILEQAERQRQKELNEQRTILQKDRDQALLREQAKFNREREAYQKKMKDMERQLERRTNHELGDGAEIDLYEELRKNFQDDRITRIQKGQSGADILHEVIYNGETCGRIVIDSKNRQSWKYEFVTKLREDQVEAKAEHAILSTTVFPSGKRELCIESDVVVVSPSRVIPLVNVLRKTIVAMHTLGLSMKERTGKINRLYRFITSEAYSQRFGEVAKLTDDMLELDVQEKKSHDNVWKKRGALLTRQSHVLREIDMDIAAIVEARTEDAVPAA